MNHFLNAAIICTIVGVFVTEASAAPDAALRKRVTTDIKKLQSPEIKVTDDSKSSNDPSAMSMVTIMNLAAFADACEKGKVPAATCDGYLTEFEAHIADNNVSFSELSPWFEKVKPFVN